MATTIVSEDHRAIRRGLSEIKAAESVAALLKANPDLLLDEDELPWAIPFDEKDDGEGL